MKLGHAKKSYTYSNYNSQQLSDPKRKWNHFPTLRGHPHVHVCSHILIHTESHECGWSHAHVLSINITPHGGRNYCKVKKGTQMGLWAQKGPYQENT